MYYLFRVIIILLAGLIIFPVLLLTGVLRVGKSTNPDKPNIQKISGWAIFTALITCFGAAAFVPYEEHFMTFSTIEDSFRYSAVPSDKLYLREYGDCAFVASCDGKIHTLNIRNGGYGICDAHSATHCYTRTSGKADEKISCIAVTNTQANKTFYLILITSRNPDNTENEITVNGEKPTYITTLQKSQNKPSLFFPVDHYYIEKDGCAYKKLIIDMHGKQVIFQ